MTGQKLINHCILTNVPNKNRSFLTGLSAKFKLSRKQKMTKRTQFGGPPWVRFVIFCFRDSLNFADKPVKNDRFLFGTFVNIQWFISFWPVIYDRFYGRSRQIPRAR